MTEIDAAVVASTARQIADAYQNSSWASVTNGSDNCFPFSTVLVAFWSVVLKCAAKCEQFVIDQAGEFAETENLKLYQVWGSNEFAEHIASLYRKRHGTECDSATGSFRSKMSVEYLFPFLLTMRFEVWFHGLPYTVNYSEQMLLHLQHLYYPRNNNESATRHDPALGHDNQIFRRVFHKLMFGRSASLNNAFAFVVHSIVSAGKTIVWDNAGRWRIEKLYSIAGSLYNAPSVQQMTEMERAVIPADGDVNAPQETTWTVILFKDTIDGSERFLHCSLATSDVNRPVFVAPMVPFIVLPPRPHLALCVQVTLRNKDKLQSQIASDKVDRKLVDMLHFCDTGSPPGDKPYYQIDLVGECQDIEQRMVDFFSCMHQSTESIGQLRLRLQQQVEQLKKRRNISKQQKALLMQEQVENTDALCNVMGHLRENSVAAYLLLVQMKPVWAERQ